MDLRVYDECRFHHDNSLSPWFVEDAIGLAHLNYESEELVPLCLAENEI
ncbi:MAG: hypothetical protein LBB27_03475 [Tannerellaceae bacterium]|nr:hypothetical protein [Tannerellaceae bacterium]